MLVMISDVSIVFCHATFNTFSTRQDICYARIIYNHQNHQRKSAKQKPGLSYAVRQSSSLTKGLMSPNQDETGLSLPRACGLMIELVWSTLLLNLSFVSRHTKVQASALQTFANILLIANRQGWIHWSYQVVLRQNTINHL